MAKIEMRGLDEYTRALAQLERGLKEQVIGAAIYNGADIVANAIKSEIDALPTDGGYGTVAHPLRGINPIQKQALADSMGITPMRSDDGVYNVKIGFDGYNPIRTRRWPRGQPNAMIARSVERGTSFLMPTAFVKKAMRGMKKKVTGIMQATIDSKIYALMRK